MTIAGPRFDGVLGVTVTPFTEDGKSVREDEISLLCNRLISQGIQHLVPCGNTGEYFSLSASERRQVTRITVETADDRAAVIAGVGGELDEARREAAYGESVGVTAIMIHQPPHPYVTEDGYLRYVASVADATTLPVLPYIRLPVLTDDGVGRLMQISRVAGVKYAHNDVVAFARAVAKGAERPDVTWICGGAEAWAPFFWAAGAVGFTSGLVNLTAVHSLNMLDALRRGDLATSMKLWNLIYPFEAMRAGSAGGFNVSVVKEAMRQVGYSVGPVREPASDVGSAQREEVTRILASWE